MTRDDMPMFRNTRDRLAVFAWVRARRPHISSISGVGKSAFHYTLAWVTRGNPTP